MRVTGGMHVAPQRAAPEGGGGGVAKSGGPGSPRALASPSPIPSDGVVYRVLLHIACPGAGLDTALRLELCCPPSCALGGQARGGDAAVLEATAMHPQDHTRQRCHAGGGVWRCGISWIS